jgi:hypothetical protein
VAWKVNQVCSGGLMYLGNPQFFSYNPVEAPEFFVFKNVVEGDWPVAWNSLTFWVSQ